MICHDLEPTLLKTVFQDSFITTVGISYAYLVKFVLFQIDEAMYDQTVNPISSDTRDLIAELLLESSLGNIDWYQTTWEDLRKPLYSALAAMLYTFDQVMYRYFMGCIIQDISFIFKTNLSQGRT